MQSAVMVYEENLPYGSRQINALWRGLIHTMYEEFILFFAPKLHDEIDFSKEPIFLQQELYEVLKENGEEHVSSILISVTLHNGCTKWLLIQIIEHNQKEYHKQLFQAFYRIYDRYQRETYTLALLTNTKPTRKQSYFDHHYFETSIIYHFNTYNFLEQDIAKLHRSSNPFAVVVLSTLSANQMGTADQKLVRKQQLLHYVRKRFGRKGNSARLYQCVINNYIEGAFEINYT